MSHHCKYRKK